MLSNSRILIFFILPVLITGIMLISCTERDIDRISGADSDIAYNHDTRRIRDFSYKDGMCFDLGRLGGDNLDFDTLAGDKIREIAVYQRIVTTIIDSAGTQCNMYVNPDDTTECASTENVNNILVTEVPEADYFVNPNSFWIFFKQPYAGSPGSCEIGVWMVIERGDGEIDTIGNISEIPYHLKLINARYPWPAYVTWDYMWRNVYDLGFGDVQPEDINVRIYKGLLGTEGSINNKDHNEAGVPYITILKLDQYDNQTGAPVPDGRFDYFSDFLSPANSFLIFPIRKPFDYHTVGDTSLTEYVPEIYNTKRGSDEVVTASRYYLEVRRKVRLDINTVMGDIDLDGTYYDPVDVRIFMFYFLIGLRAFTIDKTFQIAATDVDRDGIPLTMGDYIYLLRIIDGDTLNFDEEPADLNLNIYYSGDIMYCDKPIGGLSLVYEHKTDYLISDNMANMEIKSYYDGHYTHVLIYGLSESIEPNVPIIVCEDIPMDIKAADYYGHNYIIKTE
ncbi:MAG: hypothetical protein AB1746_05475 [Candidatus Zixiibacteriota bacterium]